MCVVVVVVAAAAAAAAFNGQQCSIVFIVIFLNMVHLSVSVICVVDVYSKLPAPAILWYQYHHSDCQLSAAESL